MPTSPQAPIHPPVLGQRLESSQWPLGVPCESTLSRAGGLPSSSLVLGGGVDPPGWTPGVAQGRLPKVSPIEMCPFTCWELAVSEATTLMTTVFEVSDGPVQRPQAMKQPEAGQVATAFHHEGHCRDQPAGREAGWLRGRPGVSRGRSLSFGVIESASDWRGLYFFTRGNSHASVLPEEWEGVCRSL